MCTFPFNHQPHTASSSGTFKIDELSNGHRLSPFLASLNKVQLSIEVC